MDFSGKIENTPKTGMWDAAERLVSPDPYLREEALDWLAREGYFASSPLAAYLLATRVADEDLEVRFHAIQILGDLLDINNSPGIVLNDPALKHVHHYFLGLRKDQLVRMFEVADRYLASEVPLKNILGLCSYAGGLLSGIVNDRKLPFPIRQLAVYFSGEIGLQEMVPVLQNLLKRIEKSQRRPGQKLSISRTGSEDALVSSAAVALSKLGSSPLPRKV